MGEISSPTAADYAWNDSQQALRENRGLAIRVDILEEQLARLQKVIDGIEIEIRIPEIK